MIPVLVLTHGPLATEILSAARRIAGDLPGCDSLVLDWDDTFAAAREKLAGKLAGMQGPAGVLILTDMFGGTPYNVAMSFRSSGRVEVVTGVNLPMLVRLCCGQPGQRDLAQLATWIVAKGRSSICSGNEARTSCLAEEAALAAPASGGGREPR